MTATAALALAAVGGGAGSVLRYLADAAVRARWTRPFPVATFAINVVGSLLLGLVVGAATPSWLVPLLGTGVLGGFTTFSTASYEVVDLARSGLWRTSLAYGLGSVVVAWCAAGLGLWIGGVV